MLLLGANAYLRLHLADRALLDRTWHTHEGRWVPQSVPEDAPALAHLSVPMQDAVARMQAALDATRGNQSLAASRLGMSARMLNHYVKKYSLRATRQTSRQRASYEAVEAVKRSESI